MESRRKLKATALGIITLLGVAATANLPIARAAGGTPCTYEFDVVAAPGLTSTPSSGTISSNGETGTATCNGPVNGKQPSGPGKTGVDGHYGIKDGDTCQGGGEGDGVQVFTFPTSDGTEHIKNTFTYDYGAFKAGALISGTFTGDRVSGTFTAQPVDGDCASRPVTKFHVKAKGTLNG
jgi:hypothetical protein